MPNIPEYPEYVVSEFQGYQNEWILSLLKGNKDDESYEYGKVLDR